MDSTPEQIQWYIKWYNSLKVVDSLDKMQHGKTRRCCPYCKQPVFADLNKNGEVFINLNHKDDCKLWNEYKKNI